MTTTVLRSWPLSAWQTFAAAFTLLVGFFFLAWVAGPAVAAVVTIPVFVLAVWRAVRVSVAFDERGVHIRNFFRDFSVPWGAVTSVELAPIHVGFVPVEIEMPAVAFVTAQSRIRALVTVADSRRAARRRLEAIEAICVAHRVPVHVKAEDLS